MHFMYRLTIFRNRQYCYVGAYWEPGLGEPYDRAPGEFHLWLVLIPGLVIRLDRALRSS